MKLEMIRLILKKIFDCIRSVFLCILWLFDLGGFLCMLLFSWIYKDDEDCGFGAGFFGFLLRTILWGLLAVLAYNFWVAK